VGDSVVVGTRVAVGTKVAVGTGVTVGTGTAVGIGVEVAGGARAAAYRRLLFASRYPAPKNGLKYCVIESVRAPCLRRSLTCSRVRLG